MGFLDENRAAAWLLRPLRRSASGGKKAAGASNAEDSTADRAFDIADCMEKGLARELISDFIQPLRDCNGLWRFQVERSEDRKEFRLFCSGGEFLMYSRVSKEQQQIGFFLYDPRLHDGQLHEPDRPAFTMKWSASKMEWTLVQERCDCIRSQRRTACSCCQEKQELLSVWHARQNIGCGINHCMDVYICPTDRCGERRLTSKLPVWNDDVGSMVLDFQGRQITSSAKNFQLVDDENPDYVICQHGKLGPQHFSLDFKFPLTVVQAFAISLTTLFWI